MKKLKQIENVKREVCKVGFRSIRLNLQKLMKPKKKNVSLRKNYYKTLIDRTTGKKNPTHLVKMVRFFSSLKRMLTYSKISIKIKQQIL